MSQVQGSSDSCVNSKYSSACKGYFNDDYLKLFTKKLFQRSPVINRGYYIRFKAIDEVLQSWTSCAKSHEVQKFQIILLGAGYDSSYLRLKKNNTLPPNCHFIEIDFYEVLKKKLQCICNVLSSEFGILHEYDSKNPSIVLHTEEYSMLGVDLRNISCLQKYLEEIGICYNLPTLFLSECSITYIETQSSANLIAWIQRQFLNAAFVTYEQIYPEDAFGLVMQNHFVQVGCPLKSILKFPNEKAQCERFKKLGWSACFAINMFDFFTSLPTGEKQRLIHLEAFDEFEMWHEKCLHYILVWASQGVLSPPSLFQPAWQNIQIIPSIEKFLNWKKYVSGDVVHRFGHQVLSLTSTICLLSGGFGILKKKHQRLGGILLYNIASKSNSNATLLNEGQLIGNRMYHTLTKLSNGAIVMLGGRASPNKTFQDVLVLEQIPERMLDDEKSTIIPDISFVVNSRESHIPVPTWRHSAAAVDVAGCEYIIIFGGCSLSAVATNGCYALDTNTWKWLHVNEQLDMPSARHSHSSVTYKKNCVIISGGLSANETVQQSVHVLDCKDWHWTLLNVSGLIPRYSHTSHIWNNHLVLVGGVTSFADRKLGVSLVDLITLQALEIQLPAQDPEYPILLCNHASYLYEDEIIIVGGGGNCFSFGTHFNRNIVVLDCKHLTQ